jgi:hypothetical protein
MKSLFLMMLYAYIFTLLEIKVTNLNVKDQHALVTNKFQSKLTNKNIENKIIKMNSPDFLKKSEFLNFTSNLEPFSNKSVLLKSIDTEIIIKKDQKDGKVKERVRYALQGGVFDSITRQISLAGTANKHYGFKLASR